jgi:hypothetical protein
VREALVRPFSKNPDFYDLFGLIPALEHYDETGEPRGFTSNSGSTFEVHSARPARRTKPNGTFQTDIVVVVNQRRPEPIDGVNKRNGWFWFRGGCGTGFACGAFDQRPRNFHPKDKLVLALRPRGLAGHSGFRAPRNNIAVEYDSNRSTVDSGFHA